METIAELIEKNKVEINRRLVDDFAKEVAKTLGWTMQHEVQKFAEEYIKEHVLPDVQKQLEAERVQLTASIVAHVKTGFDLFGQEILKKITANMGRSWTVSEIAKKMID